MRLGKILIIILFQIIVLVVAFVVVESYLRNNGHHPGSFTDDFHKVDTLQIMERSFADENGILKANPAFWNTPWWEKKGYHINEDGFRSKTFVPDTFTNNKVTSILFLGDSHTWGGSAEPITRSFVDLIDSMGYVTYNTGIHNSDPAQFWTVSKKYIPALQPDLCILLHYSLNPDLMFKRNPVPYVPMYWSTNAGILDAWKANLIPEAGQEHFATAEEAYHFFLNKYTLYGDNAGFWEKLCRQTVITTWIYKRITDWQDPIAISLQSDQEKRSPITDYFIDKIDSLCQHHGVKFKVFLLLDPEKTIDWDVAKFREEHPDIFVNYDLLIPEKISSSDFAPREYHLNNQGHKKLDDFIIGHIQREGYNINNDSKQE